MITDRDLRSAAFSPDLTEYSRVSPGDLGTPQRVLTMLRTSAVRPRGHRRCERRRDTLGRGLQGAGDP
jgi:hypothetical protein